ncbi:DNA gyrase subunit A [Phototrophicus methaneseepsis]|uniref:DNA gyrase subunit A n=1 Tax=Phototrophicus methaneseepsis TaxID=2710758 RepID=A0A7S8IDH9_9CHLR|nr:DNA gyrase subunit A [Phototrophicus methaneseepsis]QPC81582.1 DNA gyrase subunit A [Phototrophicus methaneseepsis]
MDNENFSDNVGTIRPININEEMRGSYLDYAMSVIVSRALPDARDGLKPVHRRILFAMYDMGVRAGSAHKKSARIVGEVLGKYHPHGDSAVYDAMARMAQDFSLRYPLVDGQGNFGSQDGDSPAAMRYTEARMARIAEEMLADINMDTVDFTDNYDGSQQEPIVLPSRLPNMLLNGASGIAVGMATNIPPHNMRELAAAINYLIDNYENMEEIAVDDLMTFVKGPDFPTGAQIIVGDDLKEAYATGKGRVAIRSTAEIEETKSGSMRIIFTSIPYQVSKTSIVERIVSLVREGRLEAVRDLRDESDRNGLRLVVELKKYAQPLTVLNQLYKYTQLQTFYSIQMLALVNNEPRNLSLKRSLQIYIEHRYDVIVRRSEYELERLQARAHILLGLLKAVTNIDDVIRTIRQSQDVDDARTQLMERFELTEVQATAILDMQLRRLAALERQKLQDEYDEVMARIDYLEDLLRSPYKILALIRDDVNEIAEKYGDERNTEVVYGNADFDESDLVREEQVIISLTSQGYIKRVPSRLYRAQRRGGKGVRGMTTKEEDLLIDIFASSSLDTLLFFSDAGKVYSEKAYRIPETGRANRGTLIHAVLPLAPTEHITAVLPVSTFDMEEAYFVMATRMGRIKRVHLHEFEAVRPSGLIAMSLNEDDTLSWVKYTTGDQDIIMVTEQGQSILFHESDVRVMGRPAGGVNGIKLLDDDRVAGMDVINPDLHTHIMVVTQNGFGKRTPIEDYSRQSRYGLGARTLSRNNRTGPIVAMRAINEDDGIMLISRSGIVLRTSLAQVRETGRSTQGVTVMNLGEGDEVVAMAIMAEEDDDLPESGDGVESNGASPDGAMPDGASLDGASEDSGSEDDVE